MTKVEFIETLQEILDEDKSVILGHNGYKTFSRLLIEQCKNDDYENVYKLYDGYGDNIYDVVQFDTLDEIVNDILSDNLEEYIIYRVFKNDR